MHFEYEVTGEDGEKSRIRGDFRLESAVAQNYFVLTSTFFSSSTSFSSLSSVFSIFSLFR